MLILANKDNIIKLYDHQCRYEKVSSELKENSNKYTLATCELCEHILDTKIYDPLLEKKIFPEDLGVEVTYSDLVLSIKDTRKRL